MVDKEGPMGAAQRLARPELPRKFFTAATVEPVDGSFELRLDGRPARTPAKAKLAVPSRAIAEAMAAEWNALGATIDPAALPYTRIANAAIDGVSNSMAAVRDDILAYAGSDLLCYRADTPDSLVEIQRATWSPVVDWAADSLDVRLAVTEGVIHTAQDVEEIRKLRRHLDRLDPFALAALHAITTLTGSALLAIATGSGRLSAAEAWAAAHVDEDWQAARWGRDPEAERRRATRWREMEAAAAILRDRMKAVPEE